MTIFLYKHSLHWLTTTWAGFTASYFPLLAVISKDSGTFSNPKSTWVMVGLTFTCPAATNRATCSKNFEEELCGKIYLMLFRRRTSGRSSMGPAEVRRLHYLAGVEDVIGRTALKGLRPGQPFLEAPSGALEHHVGSQASGDVADDFDGIILGGINLVVRSPTPCSVEGWWALHRPL